MPIFFENQLVFRDWLQQNHETANELIVGFYKISSHKPSLTWSQSVDQALCFGWIDGVRRTIDDESYCIRFTPRKSTSIWSAINIKKVEELQKLGSMKPEGQKAFDLRKEDRSKIYSHEKEPVKLEPAYEKQFKTNKIAWDFFNAQAPSYKKIMIYWIMNAKQEKTRLARLEKTITYSEQKKRVL